MFADPLQVSHACHRFFNCYKAHTFSSILWRCRIHCACHEEWRLNVQKRCEHVMRLPFCLAKVLCHNRVHFFDISTSKSALRMKGFNVQTYFAPQPGAVLAYFNFQKCSDPAAFLTFWLRHVLRTTTACTFWAPQLPKVFRSRNVLPFHWEMCFAPQGRVLFLHLNFQKCSDIGVFSILASKRASLHRGAHILISHPARLLRTCRFSEPTFPFSGVRSHETLLEKHCYDRCGNSGGTSQRRERVRREKVKEERKAGEKKTKCAKRYKCRHESEVWLLNVLG